MSVTEFIPTIWSETLQQKLNSQYVGVANCNREFEGEIKECGSVVKIGRLGDVQLYNYTKNTDMQPPEELDGSVRELKIDQAKYFNFQIDDVDRAQAAPNLMEAAMKNAAIALANDADTYVYRLVPFAGKTILHTAIDETETAPMSTFWRDTSRSSRSNGPSKLSMLTLYTMLCHTL